jgi:hypothetical protein
MKEDSFQGGEHTAHIGKLQGVIAVFGSFGKASRQSGTGFTVEQSSVQLICVK